jgi:hypothetical protein
MNSDPKNAAGAKEPLTEKSNRQDDRTSPGKAIMALTLVAGTCAAALPVLAVVVLVLSRNPALESGFDSTMAITLAAWLTMAAGALWVLVELTQPGASRGSWKFLLPAPLLFGGGIADELARTPSNAWASRISSSNPGACFTIIFLFALPILSSIFYVLRSVCVTSPRGAGAAAGLAAGSLAAAIYLWHCPENSLVSVAIWHGLGVVAVAVVSAYLGDKYLGRCAVG